MLTIVSANENLLERLELLIQNTPRRLVEDAKENGQPAIAQAHTLLLGPSSTGLPVQATVRRGDEAAGANSCTRWMLLMAKRGFDDHQLILQTLGDLLRLCMTMEGNLPVPEANSQQKVASPLMEILIVKKERMEEDEQSLRAHLDRIRAEWAEEWGGMAEKLRRFGESEARREQLERSESWTAQRQGNVACALAYFDDPELMSTINNFFQLGEAGFELVDTVEEEESNEKEEQQHQQMFTKPPALHWTNYPREAEVQVTFKFTFPKGTLPEWLFREWIGMGKQLLVWDYEYEWTNGILLRADELIKVTITRAGTEPNVVEISGRIDTDEAAEEEEQEREDRNQEEQENGLECSAASTPCPLQRVWPYLVRIFQQVLEDVEGRKTLPFYLSLVFIGDLFFKCPEGAPKLAARSLDAIQTLSSIQRIKSVRFRADQEQIYALNLDQCFPSFRPTKLADFNADKFPLPSPKLSIGSRCCSSSSGSEVPTAATSLGGSAICVQPSSVLQSPKLGQRIKVDRSPSCVPSFATATTAAMVGEEFNNNNNSRTMGSSPTRMDRQQPPSASLSSSPQPGQSSLHVERQLGGGYKNRGRRVSFGVIHSIPSQGDASGHSTPSGLNSPSPLLMSISSNRFSGAASPEPNEEEEKQEKDEEKQEKEEEKPNNNNSVMVENIVEEMLQKAIDEVLVTD